MNSQIVSEKIEAAVKRLESDHIDLWITLARENSDPSLPFVTDVSSKHLTAILINRNGKHEVIVHTEDEEAYQKSGLFSQITTYEENMGEVFLKVFRAINPQHLALNISLDDHLYDGLTLGLYKWMERLIGEQALGDIEISSKEILKQLRSIKSPAEIQAVKSAVDHTIDIFEESFSQMQIGMTEKEIGQLFVEGMKKRGVTNGLDAPHDPPLVCIVRCGLAHRKPGDHVVEPGDIVIIDFSLRSEGYVSDIARTCYFLREGEVQAPADINHAFDAAYDAITKSIESLKPGKRGYEVDAIGRACIESHGYPTIRHSVGHQVGRATHDGGTILGPKRKPVRPQVEGIIQVGEIYAVEPTVIQDNGLPCMLVEENVLVTEEGPVLLSERQEKLITIPVRRGME